MSKLNSEPIKIQIRDVNYNPIQNATIKVIERKTNKILYNEESLNGEVILDDIENLKSCHAFRVEIQHPHYKPAPKTNSSCVREAHRGKYHTLEYHYQDKLLVSNVYAEVREQIQNTCEDNNANTICLPKRIYDIDNHTLIEQEALQAMNNLQIHLKAYYNQDTIPNKEKQSNEQKRIYQEQKKETRWGYIVFDKDEDIDFKLTELTQNSTIPITHLKEFKRVYKEDSITKSENINKIDTKITQILNNANQDSNINNAQSQDYLLGEEIQIAFKEEWQDKQIRFFAYIEGAKSDVSVDVEKKVYRYAIITHIIKSESDASTINTSDSSSFTWQDVVIGIIALIPAVKGARIIYNISGFITKRALRMRSIQNKTTIQQYEHKIIRYIARSINRVAKPKYPKQSIGAMSHNVRVRYEERVRNNWKRSKGKTGKKLEAGGKWKNEIAQLPTKDSKGNPIFYREHDISIASSKNGRGTERIVTGHNKDGNVLYDYIYYTPNHYYDFIHLIPK